MAFMASGFRLSSFGDRVVGFRVQVAPGSLTNVNSPKPHGPLALNIPDPKPKVLAYRVLGIAAMGV